MNAVGQHLGLLALGHTAYALRNSAVGQQHELLNELVGILTHLDVGAYGMTFLIDLEVHLGAVEVHGTRCHALDAQMLSHSVEDQQGGDERRVGLGLIPAPNRQLRLRHGSAHILGTGLAACLKQCLHILVGKAPVAANGSVYDS